MSDRKPVCTLTELRDSEGKTRWRCSECDALNHNTERTRTSRRCPVCGRPIIEWIGIESDADD